MLKDEENGDKFANEPEEESHKLWGRGAKTNRNPRKVYVLGNKGSMCFTDTHLPDKRRSS